MTAQPRWREDDPPAGLFHSDDAGPGFRRLRRGKGFFIAGTDGKALRDEAQLARIRALAIPPAWSDVWISPDPAGHVQATGRDAKGRKQYRYHPHWQACRDEAKFSSLVGFAHRLPAIRDRVDRDLRLRGTPREKVIASIVWLLDHALIRIGNESYSRENGSYGLTTLRSRHVAVEGSVVRFSFVGKSGQEWKLKLLDRRIARIVRTIGELPGQHLFQYVDNGDRHPVQSSEVNAYLKEASGTAFTSKHFRTWGATVCAASLFSDVETPDTARARARAANEVIDQVAARLRNTRTVCRNCYIHPAVIGAWEDGSLSPSLAQLRRRIRKPRKGLEMDETITLRFLERWYG